MYSCDEGYILIGNEERECLDNGVWSGMAPLCFCECMHRKLEGVKGGGMVGGVMEGEGDNRERRNKGKRLEGKRERRQNDYKSRY